MSSFAIKYPFSSLFCASWWLSWARSRWYACPLICFPPINIPVVVVATFYSGMPPQQIETDITDPLRTILHPG